MLYTGGMGEEEGTDLKVLIGQLVSMMKENEVREYSSHGSQAVAAESRRIRQLMEVLCLCSR